MEGTQRTHGSHGHRPRGLALLGLSVVLACTAGCMTMGVPWAGGDQPRTGEVCQVMALWADGLVVHPDPTSNGKPTAGLAARIYLLGPDLSKPVCGDGPLTVFLYDARAPLTDKAVPQEVWNIAPDNLCQLLAKDALGWGYDLWLPWRTYRPDANQVRLVVKYQSSQGKVTWSSSTDYVVRRPGASAPTAPPQQYLSAKPVPGPGVVPAAGPAQRK